MLLKKSELRKLTSILNEKRLTLIPYTLGASNRGRLKLEFYTAKPKKNHDKRESIKQRDAQRESKRHYD